MKSKSIAIILSTILSTTALGLTSGCTAVAPGNQIANTPAQPITPSQASAVEAGQSKAAPTLGAFGFDVAGMDRTISAGEDFYQYASGTWAKNTAIPSDKSNYGMFNVLSDLSQERVNAILETEKDKEGSKIGAAYASYLDTDMIESKGLEPINGWLNQIRAVKSKADYFNILVEARKNGVGGPIASFVGQDSKNPDQYIFYVSQSGTGLPDRDMYLEDGEKLEANRTAYIKYLSKMLSLAGENNSDKRAQSLFDLEKSIAKIQWNREDNSDATKTYNKMTVAQLDAATPGMDLASMIAGFSDKIDNVIVRQPSAITGIAKIIGDADIGTLKDALIIRSLSGFSDVLPDSVADTNFAFYGTILSGTPEREIRWKRGVSFTEGMLGEDVGKLYVEKHYPPETKAAMDKLVKNVLAAMDRRIDGLEWMQAETKVKAKQKLANFTVKIGHTDQWRDYSSLKMAKDDVFGNQLRSNQFEFADDMARLGAPIRRHEWGMFPQTVNAYANFSMNEIVFPAAILQPPFFDPNADDAINYGAIGAVIGHEISHHFDDQGAKFDENGRLSDWWTAADVAAFDAAGKKLIAQYDKYEPIKGEFIKGEFTLGENIGDLAGLTLAYDAYAATLEGKEAPLLDGFTGDQRFFLGWAQVWRRNYRPAELSRRLLTDSHSPSIQRTWVVRNLDKWYEAYNPSNKDSLYLAPEERVKIW